MENSENCQPQLPTTQDDVFKLLALPGQQSKTQINLQQHDIKRENGSQMAFFLTLSFPAEQWPSTHSLAGAWTHLCISLLVIVSIALILWPITIKLLLWSKQHFMILAYSHLSVEAVTVI